MLLVEHLRILVRDYESIDVERNFVTSVRFVDSASDYFSEHSSSWFANVRRLVIELEQSVSELNVVPEQSFHLIARLFRLSFAYSGLIVHL
jgi:hypothetical protein